MPVIFLSSIKNVFIEKNLYPLNRLDGEDGKYEAESELALWESDISELLDERLVNLIWLNFCWNADLMLMHG